MKSSNRSEYDDAKWVGMRYGKLTVVEAVHKTHTNGKSQWYWKMNCDCGNVVVVRPYLAIKGKTVSCGCYRDHEKPCTTKTHGESHTRLHDIWCGINNRCNKNHSSAKCYGKRGIEICDEWHDYEKFAAWARANGYADDLTIERIDVNGNYEPDNCTWIPLAKQARNRRTTHWVYFDGREMSLAEACEINNMPYKQVFERITKRHWPVDLALTTPIGFKSMGIVIDRSTFS